MQGGANLYKTGGVLLAGTGTATNGAYMAFAFSVIASLKAYDQVWVLTQGGATALAADIITSMTAFQLGIYVPALLSFR